MLNYLRLVLLNLTEQRSLLVKNKKKKIKWLSIQIENLNLEKQSKVIGNALTAEQKSQNFLLNQLKTDLFTAENAGQKENQKEILTDSLNQK